MYNYKTKEKTTIHQSSSRRQRDNYFVSLLREIGANNIIGTGTYEDEYSEKNKPDHWVDYKDEKGNTRHIYKEGYGEHNNNGFPNEKEKEK